MSETIETNLLSPKNGARRERKNDEKSSEIFRYFSPRHDSTDTQRCEMNWILEGSALTLAADNIIHHVAFDYSINEMRDKSQPKTIPGNWLTRDLSVWDL